MNILEFTKEDYEKMFSSGNKELIKKSLNEFYKALNSLPEERQSKIRERLGLNAGKEISGEMTDEKIVSLIDKLAHLGLVD
jgi:hypothetical protein